MSLRYLKNISTLSIDRERCTGCGTCTQVCPHGVIAIEMKKALTRDIDACMECGACKRNCPADAIAVEPGVGCAYAIVTGMLKGTAPQCGCDTGGEFKSTCC
jgi:ferredoxin